MKTYLGNIGCEEMWDTNVSPDLPSQYDHLNPTDTQKSVLRKNANSFGAMVATLTDESLLYFGEHCMSQDFLSEKMYVLVETLTK